MTRITRHGTHNFNRNSLNRTDDVGDLDADENVLKLIQNKYAGCEDVD
jgi:hypothetical protein